jgi:hypothetical protein
LTTGYSTTAVPMLAMMRISSNNAPKDAPSSAAPPPRM